MPRAPRLLVVVAAVAAFVGAGLALRSRPTSQPVAAGTTQTEVGTPVSAQRVIARSPANPDRARLAALLAAKPSGNRWQQLFSLIDEWAARDPRGLLAHLESLEAEPGRARLCERALGAWLRIDATAALRFAREKASADPGAREWCLGPALEVLRSREGLMAALAFLAQLPEEPSTYTPLTPVMCTHIIQNPIMSGDAIAQIPLPEFRATFHEMRGATLARAHSWDALLRLAREPLGTVEASAARLGALSALYESSPAEVIAYIEAQPGDPGLDPLRRRLATTAIATDPAAAMRLAGRIHDVKTRSSVTASVLPFWYDQDPEHAFAWAVAGDLDPELIATAVLQGTRPTSEELRERILQADGLSDSRIRQRTQWTLVTQWLRVDRAAARSWLENSTLPQAIKDIIAPERSAAPHDHGP